MLNIKTKIKDIDFKTSRATIKDVAMKANVSLSTVSRALRDPDKTPPETVSKVRAAAEALNYVYNATAGSLSRQRSDTIGILLPSPVYAAFGVNLMAIQKTCSERNYSCKVALSQFAPEEERLALRRFHEQRIGGLILVGLDMSNVGYLKTLEAAGIPCIVLWEAPDESLNYIGIDNRRSIYTGVKYLIDMGHRRIGFLVGPYACARRNLDRVEGYKKVLEDHGIEYDPDLVRSQPPSYLLGKESMRAFLKLASPPTAVLSVNDYLAIGAMRAITEAGLRVPDDISVCGFDDIDIAAYFNPPLTSIKTPCYEMGRMAANIMIDAIESRTSPNVQYLLDTELIVRGTCKRPRQIE